MLLSRDPRLVWRSAPQLFAGSSSLAQRNVMSGTLLKPLLSSTTVDRGAKELSSLVAIHEEEPHSSPAPEEKYDEKFQRKQQIGRRHDRRYSANGGVTQRVWRTEDDGEHCTGFTAIPSACI